MVPRAVRAYDSIARLINPHPGLVDLTARVARCIHGLLVQLPVPPRMVLCPKNESGIVGLSMGSTTRTPGGDLVGPMHPVLDVPAHGPLNRVSQPAALADEVARRHRHVGRSPLHKIALTGEVPHSSETLLVHDAPCRVPQCAGWLC